MNDETTLQADIARLLRLINDTNQLIEQLHQAGKAKSSLAIRQEKHLRDKYTRELDQIMRSYQLTVSPVEA